LFRRNFLVHVSTGHASAALSRARDLPFQQTKSIYFDWDNEIGQKRVEHLCEAIDALVDRFVLDIDFEPGLVKARIKPDERVNREQLPSECDL
jgi:hypothetical protein